MSARCCFLMMNIKSVLELYLPYFGHFLMALGYILEQFEGFDPPVPSAVVLLGHIFVLSDPRALSPTRPSVQIINLIFLVSNILVFLYDFVVSLRYDLHIVSEMDQYM